MEAAETQLARALAELTTRELPLSRGRETRVDAYLQLEELLRLEDSEASVRELQRHVSKLVSEVRLDLQRNSLNDVLHAALRCLSYLMHHRSLAAAFSNEQMTLVLGDLVTLLFSTQDPATYKLCLWCLTEQNFPAERHKLLPRTVEGLVQAVVNPFKSRAIEVQALKGLHLLLVKYPEQLAVDGAVLNIYVRPIASRLASSESSTRTQARLVLEETAKHLSKWTPETLAVVQHCTEKYVLPVMKAHMDGDRKRDAVLLWNLTLILLKSKFSSDLGMLNKVLYVPEKCIEDKDAAVRLMVIHTWAELADLLRDTQNWLFNKAVVGLLVWPIKVCLEQELLLNVVDATFASWRKIVLVAVQDFNTYSNVQRQTSETGQQQSMPEWKFWFGGLVMSPLLILMKKQIQGNGHASLVELDQFIGVAKELWEPEICEIKSNLSRSENSSSTTMGGSPVDSGRFNGTSQITSNFGLRLIRMSIDFSFGLLTSRMGSTETIDVPPDQSLQNTASQTAKVVVASVGFGLEWQLRLLAPVLSGVTSPGYLQSVVLHPKSKLFDHITQRMEYLKDMYVQCAMVLGKWTTDEFEVDFSAKSNSLLYLVINLLFEYAIFVDDTNNDRGGGKQSTLKHLDFVVNKLTESIRAGAQPQARGLSTVIRFGEESIRAAYGLTAYDFSTSGNNSMLDELVRVSKNLTEHTYESQQNASILLDLHQSRGDTVVVVSATMSSVSSATPSDVSDAEEKSTNVVVQEPEYVSALLDTSTSSPSLLSGEISTASNPSPAEPSPPLSIDESSKPLEQQTDLIIAAPNDTNTKGVPATSEEISTPEQINTKSSDAAIPPSGSQSAPPKLTGGHSQRPNLKTSHCIYPDLVGCTEGIASLYRHFPMGFRPFFAFYKVKTIGDLSALPVEKVRTFGLKEPVTTVRRALEEFNGRKDRMKSLTGSPFRKKSGSATTSPAIPMPSPHKPSKRPFHLESGGIVPLPLEKREHKRTKRSLVLDGEDGGEQEESEGTRRKPKLADRVTFCLQAGETGETRITRPGEDSQDQLKSSEKVEEKENVQEKMETYRLKLLQHLRRSAYYADKLITEEENMQSEEASLETSAATVGGVMTNYQEANVLVSRLTSQLQIAAETSSTRCQKILDKRG
ncbi:Telomere-associated protein RIF1 [Phytophthora megakarya]|uniref:Telomere-associated protein RIF1 n=1 Tax=Phytophthora megakarya TaxID=4795 RepID=A0A225X3R7_9STRA|nr:Telomere-associated protein RIF1 [Phytophthora megakarya]